MWLTVSLAAADTRTQHISNIREFCSGLEYQLQFNDFRLLGQLESEGERFLSLVKHCLEAEGRLAEYNAS